jgi:hypothetical protein
LLQHGKVERVLTSLEAEDQTLTQVLSLNMSLDVLELKFSPQLSGVKLHNL